MTPVVCVDLNTNHRFQTSVVPEFFRALKRISGRRTPSQDRKDRALEFIKGWGSYDIYAGVAATDSRLLEHNKSQRSVIWKELDRRNLRRNIFAEKMAPHRGDPDLECTVLNRPILGSGGGNLEAYTMRRPSVPRAKIPPAGVDSVAWLKRSIAECLRQTEYEQKVIDLLVMAGEPLVRNPLFGRLGRAAVAGA